MTISAWRIGVDAAEYEADDMGGIGAKKTGGRWNREGTPLVYTSSNIALACLETMVHLGSSSLPLNRYLVHVEIPDDIWNARREVDRKTAPVGWDALPASRASLEFGTQWCSSHESAILCVPSTIVPEEHNILINPEHEEAKKIVAKKIRKWQYDARVWTVI